MCKVVENQAVDTAEQYKPGMEEGFAFLSQGKPVYWHKDTPEPVFKGTVRKVPFVTRKTAEGNYILFVHEGDWIVTEHSGKKVVFSDSEFKRFYSIISIV